MASELGADDAGCRRVQNFASGVRQYWHRLYSGIHSDRAKNVGLGVRVLSRRGPLWPESASTALGAWGHAPGHNSTKTPPCLRARVPCLVDTSNCSFGLDALNSPDPWTPRLAVYLVVIRWAPRSQFKLSTKVPRESKKFFAIGARSAPHHAPWLLSAGAQIER